MENVENDRKNRQQKVDNNVSSDYQIDNASDDNVKSVNEIGDMIEETFYQTSIEILESIKEYRDDVCLPFCEYVTHDSLYDFMTE
jgi:hypothetical protein